VRRKNCPAGGAKGNALDLQEPKAEGSISDGDQTLWENLGNGLT